MTSLTRDGPDNPLATDCWYQKLFFGEFVAGMTYLEELLRAISRMYFDLVNFPISALINQILLEIWPDGSLWMDLKGPFIVKIGSRESPFAIFNSSMRFCICLCGR
jgi:hypothetical protein